MVFGERKDTFADNAKYLYLQLNRVYGKQYELVWLTSDSRLRNQLRARGFRAYHPWSITGILYAMRAKFWFFTLSSKYLNFWASGGDNVKINLWHGLPLKRIGYDAGKGEVALRRRIERNPFLKGIYFLLFPWQYEGMLSAHYLFLATSPHFERIFVNAFKLRESQIIRAGYPRWAPLFGSIPGEEIGVDVCVMDSMVRYKQDGKTVILYAPTFRDDGSDSRILEIVDWTDFDRFLGDHNSILVIKPHPYSTLASMPKFNNIFVADPHTDIYPLLRHADILITDYSSIYFDFLLLDRPIIFFCYDLEDYIRRNRELYFDYDDITPGHKARTYSDLKRAIDDVLGGNDPFAAERGRIRKLVFDPHVDLIEYIRKSADELL